MEIADAEGTFRATVGAWLDGSAGLDVFDAQRNHRVSVGELLDGAGTLRSRVGQRADGGPSIELYGPDGRFIVAIGQYPDGAGRLALWDADGTPVVGEVP